MKNTKLSPFDMETESLINFRSTDVVDDDIDIANDNEDVIVDEIEEEEEEEDDTTVDTGTADDIHEEIDTNGGIPSKTNPIAILAKSFKEDGVLPDDIEIADDITDVQFAEIYRKSKEDLIKNEIRNELIEKEGLSPEILNTAKQIHLGIAPKEIEQLNLYNSLGSINFDEDAENYEEVAGQYLALYYKDINFDQALINRQVERDVNSDTDELAEVLAVAKKHFGTKARETKELNDSKAKATELQNLKDEQDKIDKMEAILNSGIIKGVKYSKSDMEKVRKALFEKSEIYVDPNGNKRMVTLYQKRRMEIASDFEYSFKQIADVVLGPKEAKTAIETQEKAKSSILSELNNSVSKIPSMSGKGSSNGSNISKYGTKVFSI